MFVERELLRRHWGPVARALIVAMPITLALLALAAKALFPELSWAEAFLLGAVLSPTDPVVTSAVVTSRLVPGCGPPHAQPRVRPQRRPRAALRPLLPRPRLARRRRRHRSGEAASARRRSAPSIGVALGRGGGRLHHRLPGGGLTARYEGIYAVGFALFAFGLADVTFGNGLIAAFVCGIAMGAAERDVPEGFVEFAENASAILQVLTFFVFGALIVATGFDHIAPALVVFVVFALLSRGPLAVLLSFVPDGARHAAEAVHGLVRARRGSPRCCSPSSCSSPTVGEGELIFDVAAIAIIASIVAHGLTDTVGANWIARRIATPDGTSRSDEAG